MPLVALPLPEHLILEALRLTDELLWTPQGLARYLVHPDKRVRDWAVRRLIDVFPKDATQYLDAALDDEDELNAKLAIRHYGLSGDLGPVPMLMDRLKSSKGEMFGCYAEALARLGAEEALPILLRRFEEAAAGEKFGHAEFIRITHALALFGGKKPRELLWTMLGESPGDDYLSDTLMQALALCLLPRDILPLLKHHRTNSPVEHAEPALKALASVLGEQRLASDVMRGEDSLENALEAAQWWIGFPPRISEECLNQLRTYSDLGHENVLPTLLEEARRIVREQDGDAQAWLEAWDRGEPTKGYKRYAVYVPTLLGALAGMPKAARKLRRTEGAFGLAMVCALSVQKHDELAIDNATDRIRTLMGVLVDSRENVLPDIMDQISAVGPDIAPKLIESLDPSTSEWGLIRTTRAIERLAREHSGSCDQAVDRLIGLINDEAGDFLLEAASDALRAIGPPAVPVIARSLPSDDSARDIYLTGVLGDIPTEASAQAVLSLIKEDQPIDESYIEKLQEIGSPAAIEPLCSYWRAVSQQEAAVELVDLAETLLVLCEVNGVERPEIKDWRRVIKAREEQKREFAGVWQTVAGNVAGGAEAEHSPLSLPTRQGSTRKAKTVSKQEKKKRAAHRKANKKKR